MQIVRERIDVGGVFLAVRRCAGEGTRPPFLLVHGLASNARLWDGMLPLLSEAGHTVVAVDQRGHGRSDRPDDGYDFDTLTGDLAGLIDHLGLDRPVVVGQSWGGNVALELAARNPELVAGVVGLDGGTIDLRASFDSWEQCARALAPPDLAGHTPGKLERMFRRAHADWPDTGIRGTLANFERLPDGTARPRLSRERHMTILRHLYAHRPADCYPKVLVPVLLLPVEPGPAGWSPGKRAAVDTAARGLPNVRVHWCTGDHDYHAQHPAEVVRLLLQSVSDGFFE